MPSTSTAPRTVLPSTASNTGRTGSAPLPVSVVAHPVVVALTGSVVSSVVLDSSPRSHNQAPTAASTDAASTSVSTRQIVAFDGGTGDADTRPRRAYIDISRSAGVSIIHPAIAVNDRMPATTAPAHNASTTDTGWSTHRTRRGSLIFAKWPNRSIIANGAGTSHEDKADQRRESPSRQAVAD